MNSRPIAARIKELIYRLLSEREAIVLGDDNGVPADPSKSKCSLLDLYLNNPVRPT